MARSPDNNPIAFPAEIARYLCVERTDVPVLIRESRLPALRIDKKKRKVLRIPLRDFHEWLKRQRAGSDSVMGTYETFLADFNQVARHSQPTS
jgi:excisionase family DNA binding protein